MKSQTAARTAAPTSASDAPRITMRGSPLGIANGFLYGYQGVSAYEFMPTVRRLGADFTKTYLFWNQVEPKRGTYDWTAVDAFVNQLKFADEALVGVFSASEWAVTKPSALLPPSPAKNPDDYYRFIFDLVSHCKGRVRYWQNDAEPNSPIFWGGTKEEFVAELALFHKAVKAADPDAVVVVGGYDGLFGPPGTFQFPNQQAGLDFFDYVFKEGHDAFDVFDLRLYGDPYTIVPRVDYMRQMMRAHGFEKPVICTEYGGPNLFELPANRKVHPARRGVVAGRNRLVGPDLGKRRRRRRRRSLQDHEHARAGNADVHAGMSAGTGGEVPADPGPRHRRAQPVRALGRRAEDDLLVSAGGPDRGRRALQRDDADVRKDRPRRAFEPGLRRPASRRRGVSAYGGGTRRRRARHAHRRRRSTVGDALPRRSRAERQCGSPGNAATRSSAKTPPPSPSTGIRMASHAHRRLRHGRRDRDARRRRARCVTDTPVFLQ